MKKIGGMIAFFGLILFGFGMYIIPFGTDLYLYFWVERVFNGNWLYGSIAANLVALFMIIAGLIIKIKFENATKNKKGGRSK